MVGVIVFFIVLFVLYIIEYCLKNLVKRIYVNGSMLRREECGDIDIVYGVNEWCMSMDR